MVALAVALSGYGFYQRAYVMPRTLAEYEADPDQAMRDADSWFAPGSPERTLFEYRVRNVEPTATFALTNSLAGYLSPWLVVLAGSNDMRDCENCRRRLRSPIRGRPADHRRREAASYNKGGCSL